jgi:hypothetical protein
VKGREREEEKKGRGEDWKRRMGKKEKRNVAGKELWRRRGKEENKILVQKVDRVTPLADLPHFFLRKYPAEYFDVYIGKGEGGGGISLLAPRLLMKVTFGISRKSKF